MTSRPKTELERKRVTAGRAAADRTMTARRGVCPQSAGPAPEPGKHQADSALLSWKVNSLTQVASSSSPEQYLA